jgi:hypothetical protein
MNSVATGVEGDAAITHGDQNMPPGERDSPTRVLGRANACRIINAV